MGLSLLSIPSGNVSNGETESETWRVILVTLIPLRSTSQNSIVSFSFDQKLFIACKITDHGSVPVRLGDWPYLKSNWNQC